VRLDTSKLDPGVIWLAKGAEGESKVSGTPAIVGCEGVSSMSEELMVGEGEFCNRVAAGLEGVYA
jgi:hypothetical protein